MICERVEIGAMERDSLHAIDRSLSLYNNYNYNFNPGISTTYWSFSPSSVGLLKAPPLPLLQPPPLLPLPRRTSSFPGPSSVKNNNNNRKTRDQAFTSKKPTKSSSTNNKKEDKRSWDSVTLSSSSKLRSGELRENVVVSPPPSSLPLPTFSLRPKLPTDAGATDDLRRILRLQ